MPLPSQTHALPSLASLTILRAPVSGETGFPSGRWMLNLSFPTPGLAQPPATVMGGRRAGRFHQAFFFSYLGSLGLIFLLGILHGLQVVSGTVIVHKFPTPLGNSFLTQSQERGPWYSLFRGQDEDNRVARLLGPITKFHFLTALCPWDFPHYLDRMGILVRA